MCHNPLRSNIEHSCKQHSTGRLTICRVTITQIHKHKIELGGTLYSLHLQSDRLGREAAAWNNEPLPSQGTHCKHTFHTAVQESVLFEQRSEHCGDLVPTRPVRQLSMCSPCVLTSKFETPPHHRHNPKLCFIVLLLMTSWKSEEKNIPLLLPWYCWCEWKHCRLSNNPLGKWIHIFCPIPLMSGVYGSILSTGKI